MDNVIIVNEKEFERKKDALIQGGAESLLVIGDFGRTFTKCFKDGNKVSTSFSQIRDGGYLSEEYRKETQEMFDKYYPIEVDQKIDRDEKIKTLVGWWKEHMKLLVEKGFSKEIIKDMVSRGYFPLRDGVYEFLDNLKERRVPLIIVSQGLGDIYIELLKESDKFNENIFFVTNLFEFDDNGKAVGVREPIINSFNKDRINFEKFDFFDKIKDKKNVLLLGDYMEDVSVIDNFNFDNAIKIGFLNERVDEKLEDYKKKYDVLILDDGDFSFVNSLVEEIIG